jgi:hypothetical protein
MATAIEENQRKMREESRNRNGVASHLKHRSGEKPASGNGGSEAVNFGANPGENMKMTIGENMAARSLKMRRQLNKWHL